jgi:hypothetical protein
MWNRPGTFRCCRLAAASGKKKNLPTNGAVQKIQFAYIEALPAGQLRSAGLGLLDPDCAWRGCVRWTGVTTKQ